MSGHTSPPANDRSTAALAESYTLEACLRDATPEYDAKTQFRPFVFASLYRITWVRLYSTLHTNSGLQSLGAVLPADDFLAASNYRGLSENSPILVLVVGAGYWLRHLVHSCYLFLCECLFPPCHVRNTVPSYVVYGALRGVYRIARPGIPHHVLFHRRAPLQSQSFIQIPQLSYGVAGQDFVLSD